MADTRYGGFLELMGRDWQPAAPGIYGGDRKSLDVHMHMMEALTAFYEMTRHPTHRRRLIEIIDLILGRMLRPTARDTSSSRWTFSRSLPSCSRCPGVATQSLPTALPGRSR